MHPLEVWRPAALLVKGVARVQHYDFLVPFTFRSPAVSFVVSHTDFVLLTRISEAGAPEQVSGGTNIPGIGLAPAAHVNLL